MKKVILLSTFFILLPILSMVQGQSNGLKPFILIGESGKSVQKTVDAITGSIFMEDEIEILGKYNPLDDPDRFIIAVTNQDLIKAVKIGDPTTGFAAVMRLAITKQGEMTYVSCQNPVYWGNVFFQGDYPEVEEYFVAFQKKLMKSMPRIRGRFNRSFGSTVGITTEKLQHYRYGFRMPYFEEMINLGTFSNFSEAKKVIEKNLASSDVLVKVFEKEVPGKNVKLYGIGLRGPRGESSFFPTIDTGDWKHTASLPLEILVVDKKVLMLDGKFRIPVSFPDMPKRTFKKIRSTPDDIKALFETLVKY